MKKRYMQGKCAVIELTCLDESERQFGFVHSNPGIMILIEAFHANDVINTSAAALEWQRSRRYILQAAVTISLMQYNRNDKETWKSPKSVQKRHFVGCRKNTYISELARMITDDFFSFFRFVLHSKKIMADYQAFAGLRGGSPALSLKTPLPPCGAQN